MIQLSNDLLEVGIKEKGAELTRVHHKQNNLDYMWSGDPAFWGKTSPILFPIVGTLKDDTFTHNGKSYKLPRHGFARDRMFEVESLSSDRVTLLQTSDASTLDKYPFEFALRVTYTLVGNSLEVMYNVTNSGKEEMLFSLGAHPAFATPVGGNGSYNDHFLLFNKSEQADRWPIDAKGLIEKIPTPSFSGDRLPLNKSLFENDALVFKHFNSDQIALRSTKHEHGLDFHFPGFPFFGIWAAKNADFVCLEPWCGVADSVDHDQQLSNKEGIEKLAPSGTWSRAWTVKFY